MSNTFPLAGRTKQEARDLLRGAALAARHAQNFKSGAPRRPEGKTLSKGTGTPTLSGVVMEAIELTPDVTSEPEDYTFGKIRIVGKEYPTTDENGQPIEPMFDDCACLTLAKDPDGTNHEQLYKGKIVNVTGPHKRKNPDYDPEDEESEEPEYIEYYTTAEYKGYYYAVLDDDLFSGGFSTITVKDSDGNDVVMSVSGGSIREGFMIKGNAEHYIIESNETNDGGWALMAIGGPCAIEYVEEEEETEEP